MAEIALINEDKVSADAYIVRQYGSPHFYRHTNS
jgi:hypothetical protein